MAFTMMATAGAAYTDQADIQATEAVDTLTALSVMAGDPDGSFRPNDTITRAEACRMIYTIRSGGNDDASAYAGMQTTFTDVPNDAWYAGYVKHCQSVGIVSGKSSTIFDPNANVTGVELALMCLRVMGYDPAKANIGGSTWSTTTIGLATEAGLLEDFNATVTNDCPRQYAAQLMYNMLNADTVRWSDDAGDYVKDEQRISGTTLTEYITVGEKYMSLIKVTGTLQASGKVGLDGAGSEEALVLDPNSLSSADKAAGKETSFDDVTTDYSDMIGQTVQVLYKEKNSDTTVYGVFATDDNKVNISTTANNLESQSGEDKIKVDGTKYTVDYQGSYMPIYTVAASGTGASITEDKSVTNASTLETKINDLDNNGVDVQVISNDGDSKIDMIIVFDKTFAKLTATNSSSVTYRTVKTDMSGDTTTTGDKLDLEDDAPVLYDGYAKDDYVFVSADLYNDAVVVEKAETVTGTASATKEDSISIGGTWYDYYDTGANGFNAKAGNDYTAYVLNGFAYYVEGAAATDVDTLLVKSIGDYNKINEGVEAKVLFEDGTEKVINVERLVVPSAGFDQDKFDEDAKATDNKATVYAGAAADGDISIAFTAGLNEFVKPALYTYDVDGSDYTLFLVNDNYTSGAKIDAVQGANDYISKTETIDSKDIDDAAVIYLNYNGGSDWKVITGSALASYDDITGDAKSAYVADDGTIVAAFLSSAAKLNTTDTLYGVVSSSYTSTNSDGDRVVYLDLITPEGAKTVETEETKVANFTKGDIVSFTGTYEKAVGTVTVESDTQSTGAQSQGYIAVDRVSSNNLITPKSTYNDGDAEYTIDVAVPQAGKIVSDTAVIYIDESNKTYEYVESDSIAEANEFATSGIYANAYVIVDDNELDLIVYEVNGKLRDGNDTFKVLNATKSSVVAANKEQEAKNALVATLAGNGNGTGFTYGFNQVSDSNVYTIDTGVDLSSLKNVTTAITADWGTDVTVTLNKLDSAPSAGNSGDFQDVNYKALASETETDVKMDNRAIQLMQTDVGTTTTNWTAVKVTITAATVADATTPAASQEIILCVNGNT